MSGTGKFNAGQAGTAIAGIALGTIAASLLAKKLLSSQSETVQGIVPIAAGIALPMFIKNDIARTAGYGMIAVGVTKFLTKFNIAGVGEDAGYPVMVAGDDLSVIAGDDDFAMAGDDDFAMAGDDNISVLAGLEEC
jgi:hypothetical protein